MNRSPSRTRRKDVHTPVRRGIPPAIRILALSIAVFLVFILYGRLNFYRDPGSVFFDISRAFERRYSLFRETEAGAYKTRARKLLKAQTQAQDGIYKRGSDPKMCVVFITARRQGGQQYVDMAVSSALAGMTKSEREDIDLRLFFSNADPTTHPAWDSWLGSVVDETFTATDVAPYIKQQRLAKLEQHGEFHEKAGLDYTLALERCAQNSSAPYIAIFEDDIIVADGWFARAMEGLRQIKVKFDMAPEKWLDMRLFNQERSTGWASRSLFANNVGIITFGADILAIAVLYALKRFRGPFSSLITPSSTVVICVFVIPCSVILFFQSGKASMLPPAAGVHREDNFGCCNQGLVFSRANVLDLAHYLDEVSSRDMPHDNAMRVYTREKQLARFALYPMMVQHLGFKSIITPDRTDEMEVWSMAFENLNPKKLAKEHERLVKQQYGDEHA